MSTERGLARGITFGITFGIALVSLLFVSNEASAQVYVVPQYYQQPQQVYAPAPYNHDNGLMLRLTLGGGYTVAPDRGSDERIHGGSFIYNAAIGAAILPNVVLEGDAFGLFALSPNVTSSGTTIDAGGDVAFLAAGIGAGLTFWIMPHNIYISGAVGFALAQIETNGVVTSETQIGVGFNAMIGKEWWISRSLGLGIAAQSMYMTLPDGSGRRDVFAAGLAITSSFQ
jgi:hypothetical protein